MRIDIKELENKTPGLADGTLYDQTSLKNLDVKKYSNRDDFSLYRDEGEDNVGNIFLRNIGKLQIFPCLCESNNRLGSAV